MQSIKKFKICLLSLFFPFYQAFLYLWVSIYLLLSSGLQTLFLYMYLSCISFIKKVNNNINKKKTCSSNLLNFQNFFLLFFLLKIILTSFISLPHSHSAIGSEHSSILNAVPYKVIKLCLLIYGRKFS